MRIVRPVLLLDRDKCEKNIGRMMIKSRKNGCRFEPHFKTHQSKVIGEWYREFGVQAITVSSLKMADYFARNGWKKITVAFPANLQEADLIDELAVKTELTLLISDHKVLPKLIPLVRQPLNYLIEIDNGYHRSGIDMDDLDKIEEMTELTKDTNLLFKGFHCHAGNMYKAGSVEEIKRIGEDTIEKLSGLKIIFSALYPELEISYGDTPSCSLLESLEGVDVIRPGNFIFYDLQQLRLGACTWQDIALSLVCPLVAVYPERREGIIYGGAVHLSKDYLLNEDGSQNFGLICRYNGQGWDEPIAGCFVKAISQEHGIISIPEGQHFEPGESLCVLPVHSCLTADCMNHYLTTEGELIEMMPKV